MAILADVTTNSGAVMAQQYIRIDRLVIDRSNGLVITLGFYQNAEQAASGIPYESEDRLYDYDLATMEGKDPIAYVYEIVMADFPDGTLV